MIKLNHKYLEKVVGEPVDKQVLDNNMPVEIYMMNDQPFYTEFINKGKFFFWACDGKSICKIFIEKGYYDALSNLFQPKVNQIWSDYYDRADAAQGKVRKKFFIPLLIGYLLVFGVLFFCSSKGWINTQVQMIIYIILLVVMMFASGRINKWVKFQIDAAQDEAITKIKKVVGTKEYKRMLNVQEKYRNHFYGNDEDTVEEDEASEENEETKKTEEPRQLEDSIEETTEI